MSQHFDWRDLGASDPTRRKPSELSAVQKEILRLHQQGFQVRDLATLFGMNDADVHLLIFGNDEPGAV